MTWTKQHSQNAVAAKERRRLAAAVSGQAETAQRVARPRSRAKWRIQLRDLEHGDSLTLTLYRLPWPARYVDTFGTEHSASSLGRVITAMLREAA